MSNLAVHPDDTCNGLQHYAAPDGEAVVNLCVTGRPSDVHAYVAGMMRQAIDETVKRRDKYAQVLKGKIARKIVKQTVCLYFQAIEGASTLRYRCAGHDHCARHYLYRRAI